MGTVHLLKMLRPVSLLLILLINSTILTFTPTDISKRFEYKLSFKGPHLIFKDGSVPFWHHSGSAIGSNDQIRLTPSIKSQKGRIWAEHRQNSTDWEIEVFMRVSGRGRIGADGMAIWYTQEKGQDGPVFGSNDNWKGLGIFLDSFDNDMQQNNPYISVMINDGTKTFDHQHDGLTQQIGGCLRDFRNKPFPVRLHIEYYKRALTVMYHSGLNNDPASYEICTRVENIDLPPGGYYGVSAATGGLADDHDVLAFLTHSLIEKSSQTGQQNVQNEKLDKEYQEFVKQLEAEKDRYKKEHPENANENIDEKKVYEGENDRQFRIMLDIQNSIHQSIRTLDSKLAEVLGRQERIVSLLSNQQPVQQQQQQPGVGQPVPVDSFRRDEVNLVINQQNELVRTVRDIHSSIIDVHKKTNVLHDTTANRQSPPPQQIVTQHQPSVDPLVLQQINDGIKNLKFEFANAQALNRQPIPPAPQVKCPENAHCLSTFFFSVFIGFQTVFFIAYFIYKNRAETQMKKFY